MPSRRDIFTYAAAVSVGVFARQQIGTAEKLVNTSRIRSVVRRDETIVRHGGSGDNWHMSWAANDRQVVSLCDGYGWSKTPKGKYNSKLLSISGGPEDARFHELLGYPDLIPKTGDTRYYNFGTLAVDSRIYQFLSTFNHSYAHPDGTPWPNQHFSGTKLIYSPDNGRTWCNQDGTTPVIWPSWTERSRKTLAFFEEDQDAFSILSIAQMGRSYADNRDGYVYVYSPNGITDGTMNQLVMFRVPRAQLLDRGAYEYFTGLRPDGGAGWSKDLKLRGVVHTFPRGWVNTTEHPWAWVPSVTHNSPLGLFLMANWGTASAPDGMWFDRPSYLGFWAASNPWGPWIQIHEETAWIPGGDSKARAFAPQISPKWIAEDGKSFWLVWSDYQQNEAECKRLNEIAKHSSDPSVAKAVRIADQFRRCLPNYSFNAQRVDLIL